MKTKIERNINLDYIYTILSNLNMSSFIWVLYLAYRGMSLAEIGILEGIFHATSMLCEVPSGAAADLLGRRNSILAGRISYALSCILMLFSGGFWGFALSFIVQALGYNLNSGSEEALVYDSMKLCGREQEYLKVNSRINVLIEISQSIATVAGGVLAEYSYAWCYMISFLLAVSSIVPAWLMTEPEGMGAEGEASRQTAESSGEGERKGFLDIAAGHFKICAGILRGDRRIRNVLMNYSAVFAVHTVLFFYSQQYFYELGLNKIQISMIMLLAGGASCLGAVSSEKLFGWLGGRCAYVGAAGIAASLAGFGADQMWLSIVLFFTASFFNSLLYPIQSISLNRLIPTQQRATLISVNSMLFSVLMILIFPLAGACADRMGLAKVFGFIGAAMLCGIAGKLIKGKRAEK